MTESGRTKVLITGALGQLGRELVATAPDRYDVHALGRQDLDVGDPHVVAEWIERHRPGLVVNAAGYTAVDRAESDRDSACRVNSLAPGYLAEAVARIGARLIHMSTDYVFDGAQSRPYRPDDSARPLNVYGETKLGGERRVLDGLGKRALVVRTSWLYSGHGNNFVRTMIRVMREREEVKVVCDQIGTPTWALGLAQAIWIAAERAELCGVHHWTDAGVASWYDFAVAIQEEGVTCGLLSRATSILPIRTEDFTAAARRPLYSVLEKYDTWREFGCLPQHWRAALRAMMRSLVDT